MHRRDVLNAVPQTSGVLTIGGTPHPYLIEGTGLTCIVVGLAPSYPPLFPDRLDYHATAEINWKVSEVKAHA